MPFGSATIVSSGQSASGRSHGRSSRPGSTVAAVMDIESGTVVPLVSGTAESPRPAW